MANMTFGVNLIPKTDNTYTLGDSNHKWNIHSKQSVYYGVCDTAADTQTKTVTIDGITSLFNGLQVRIRFTNAQTYDGQPQLNINSLGAKGITIRKDVAAPRYLWNEGEILDFVYDGTNFVAVDQTYASTTFFGMTKLVDSISSTATDKAATPNSVKQAYDLANTAATQNITMARLPLISKTYYPNLEVGGISVSTGEDTSQTSATGKARARTPNFIQYGSGASITANTNYDYKIITYTSAGVWVDSSEDWLSGTNTVPTCDQYRILIKNDNITDFTGVTNNFITAPDYNTIQNRFDLIFNNMPLSSDGVEF